MLTNSSEPSGAEEAHDVLLEALRDLRLRSGQPSLRAMARQLGTVSHAALADVFTGRRTPSWATLVGLVEILGGDKDKFYNLWVAERELRAPKTAGTQGPFAARYRRAATWLHSRLSLPDLYNRTQVAIEDLYVQPLIQAVWPTETPSSLDISNFDHAPSRVVLLGEPGAGKSTACQVLMQQYASDPERPLPFLLTIRNFALGESPPRVSVVRHLEHLLGGLYQCEPPEGWVTQVLESGNALVIFDGLDEVLDTARRVEMAQIIELFCADFPKTRVVVTSRIAGYRTGRLDSALFSTYRLNGFDQPRVEEFVHRWFHLADFRPTASTDDLATKFWHESEFVSDLRANPLILTLLCILYRDKGRLPDSRAEVYKSCSDLLFEQWDRLRGVADHMSIGRLMRPLIGFLALWMLERGQSAAGVPADELVAAVTQFLEGRSGDKYEAEALAREFVAYCNGRAWVLTDIGMSPKGNLYAFTHRSFLEYFAGEHLARSSDTPEDLARTLVQRLRSNEWHVVAEIASLLVDRRIVDGGDRLVRALIEASKQVSLQERGHIVEFLGRVTGLVQLRPSTRSELETIDHG